MYISYVNCTKCISVYIIDQHNRWIIAWNCYRNRAGTGISDVLISCHCVKLESAELWLPNAFCMVTRLSINDLCCEVLNKRHVRRRIVKILPRIPCKFEAWFDLVFVLCVWHCPDAWQGTACVRVFAVRWRSHALMSVLTACILYIYLVKASTVFSSGSAWKREPPS